ncbi:MAG: hypothetical protein H6703_15060 [Myxococcales bacterium]|nr:hypothetical protein [Myxococcales bacterium]
MTRNQNHYVHALAWACAWLGFGVPETRRLILLSLPADITMRLRVDPQPYSQVLSDLRALADLSHGRPEARCPLMVYLATGLELTLGHASPPGGGFDPGPGWSRHFTGARPEPAFSAGLGFERHPSPHLVITLHGPGRTTLHLRIGHIVRLILRAGRRERRPPWRRRSGP